MWAWVLDRRSEPFSKSSPYGWSGTMTLPRELSLTKDGTLLINPVDELKQLRTNGRKHTNIKVTDGLSVRLDDVAGDCLELDMIIDPGEAKRFGLKVRCSPDEQEETVICYESGKKQLLIDMAKSSLDDIKYYTLSMNLPNHTPDMLDQLVTQQAAPFELNESEKLRLRIFLDRSILEVFANGRQCITQRIYPKREDSLGIVLFSEGGSMIVEALEAWDIVPTVSW